MSAAPRHLRDYRGLHAGETLVVCGCGRSLAELPEPERRLTVGVNDVGRLFDPTYLVVLNPRNQFKGDRFRHVEATRARAVFTQLDLRLRHPRVVRFRLGQRSGTDLSDPDRLPYTRNSPYVALCLAAFLGAKRIGLIGVDFTDHHFFGRTGRHPLSRDLTTIDREYRRLGEALAGRGVEVVNLSRESRLTAFPKRAPESWLEGDPTPAPVPAAVETRETPEETSEEASAPRRLFLVHYPFLSCGDVFTRGLERAASELGLVCATASCKDPALPAKIERFAPDVLFVIHGRTFRQRHPDGLRGRFPSLHRAVWLLDEPYEVDDTETTSALFDTVFVNDPATLDRHHDAHYLPVAWDPGIHRPGAHPPGSAERDLDVGFIGGGNPSRERTLDRLARAGLLSYVVGGPWRSPRLRKLCRSRNVPPAETVALYQRTKLVINVFRDRHHFNRRGVVATSLNPRVYEALACGALVISEHRPELDEVFPELPVFGSEEELETRVRELLEDDAARHELLAASRRRLDGHTYRNRLERVIEVAFGETHEAEREEVVVERDEPVAANGPGTEEAPTPTYSVLMVVHNGLPMTRLATLRTLRHLRGHDARLVVVDHGSDDGSETWLRLLERRGDLDLLRREDNPGHGPGLEQARAATRSPYLVTLDSDAFPLADDWLPRLRRRLDDGAQAAGIGHYRGYIHPSCLMIRRQTLDEMGLTFLDEKRLDPKSRPRRRRGSRATHRLDVAERISVEIVERGGRLAPLEQLASQRRGSVSEPVDLGVEYGDADGPLVHHQWYSTRALCAGSAPVDDVPRERLDRSLEKTLARCDAEDRELTVVVGVRAGEREPERRRNARAVLEALNLQDLERWRYRIVVVEQDAEPRLERVLGALTDRWIFARNAGPYSSAWGRNVGAAHAGSGVLCLLDADLLPPRDFLRRAVETIRDGTRAALPYRQVVYLDERSTGRVLEAGYEATAASLAGGRGKLRWKGRRFTDSQGGCLWIDAELYREIGGHDERFRGWGWEDREMWDRLSRSTEIRTVPQTLLHLHHPPAPTNDSWARANHRLYQRLRREPAPAEPRPIGDPDRYRDERSLDGSRTASGDETGDGPAGRRAWEHWHGWRPERLEEIVDTERSLGPEASSRHRLARLLATLGDSVLDLGCGPGALRARLDPTEGPKWVGADVTLGMLVTLRRLFPGAPVCRADAGRLPYRDGSFDVVVLRHVLEHLPRWLMEATLDEALRVARRAVVPVFYVAPLAKSPEGSRTRTVGEGFLETAWTREQIEALVERAGWRVAVRDSPAEGPAHGDEIWLLQPRQRAVPDAFTAALTNGHEPMGHEPLKISIVLPTFRRPELLPRTLDSLRAQTYRNWELIVVDNGGDVDPSDAVFEDPRIRVVRHTEQTSASYARNRGLGYVTGDLVCFFDDEMLPGYLEAFADAFRKHPRAKMVRCGLILADGRTVHSDATPECCLRREFATPTWGRDRLHDQLYFRRIVRRNGWSSARGDVVVVRQALVRAGAADHGGLRAGAL